MTCFPRISLYLPFCPCTNDDENDDDGDDDDDDDNETHGRHCIFMETFKLVTYKHHLS